MNNNQKKIYVKSEGKFIPVTDAVYYAYYRPLWAIRDKARRKGKCLCPRKQAYLCDGDCLNCEFAIEGNDISLDAAVDIDDDAVRYGDLMASDFDLEALVTDSVLFDRLIEELIRLDPDGQKILKLWEMGLTDRKIGKLLGRNINSFKGKLRRIRKKLKRLL